MAKVEPVFMFITAVHGPEGKSFEEVRIDDYLKAYSTTGRPPQPPPSLPAGENERRALGLPPLFQPHTESSVSGPSAPPPLSNSTSTRVVNPNELPAAQAFHATPHLGETMQSMACMSGFTGFSHEELRYYAYLRGNKFPPTPVPLDTFIPTQYPKASASPSTSSPLPSVSVADPGDQLQNISTQPGFTGHSPEELRVMYLLSGRELTPAEIIQAQQGHLPAPLPTAPVAPIASTSTLPPPPVTPSAQRTSIFGLNSARPTAGSAGLFGTPAATSTGGIFAPTTPGATPANLFAPQATPTPRGAHFKF